MNSFQDHETTPLFDSTDTDADTDFATLAPPAPLRATASTTTTTRATTTPDEKVLADLDTLMEKVELCRDMLSAEGRAALDRDDSPILDVVGFLEACEPRMVQLVESATSGLLKKESTLMRCLHVNDALLQTLAVCRGEADLPPATAMRKPHRIAHNESIVTHPDDDDDGVGIDTSDLDFDVDDLAFDEDDGNNLPLAGGGSVKAGGNVSAFKTDPFEEEDLFALQNQQGDAKKAAAPSGKPPPTKPSPLDNFDDFDAFLNERTAKNQL